jgi:hypothetical protein
MSLKSIFCRHAVRLKAAVMSLKSIFCRHAVRLKAADLDKNALTWQCSKCSKTFIRNPNN